MKMPKDLVRASAEAVTEAYVQQTDLAEFPPLLGAHILVYWDREEAGALAGQMTGLKAEKAGYCSANGCLHDLWRPFDPEGFDVEMVYLDVDSDPACRTLWKWMKKHDDDRPVEPHFLLLAQMLGARWGFPVVTEGHTWAPDLRPQILANLDERTAAEWDAKGWLPAAATKRA